jgi:hypothetical protein
MGKVIRPNFPRQKRYHLACNECNSINWSIHLDPDIGQAIVDDVDNFDNLDFECTAVECLECGYTIQMRGMPHN